MKPNRLQPEVVWEPIDPDQAAAALRRAFRIILRPKPPESGSKASLADQKEAADPK